MIKILCAELFEATFKIKMHIRNNYRNIYKIWWIERLAFIRKRLRNLINKENQQNMKYTENNLQINNFKC